jgi:hypothetical protein
LSAFINASNATLADRQGGQIFSAGIRAAFPASAGARRWVPGEGYASGFFEYDR